MRIIPLGAAMLALAACSPRSEPAKPAEAPAVPATPAKTEAPAGTYALEREHTSVTFRVNHMGMSRYTARFTGMDGKLAFDPARPEAMSVTAEIDPASIRTDYPDPKHDFDKQLGGPEFFDTAKFPKMTFRSTKVELTGPNTARVTGDLTLHGVTRPVSLETTFNGGSPPNAMDPKGARIGFSAHGSLKRSEFGMGYGVPAPGSNMGVGDDVEILIETEFTKAGAPAPAPAG